MGAESLVKLERAFRRWRLRKRNIREAVPKALMDRAYRASVVHGPRAVAVAVKIDQMRLSARLKSGKVDKVGNTKAARLSKARKESQSGEVGGDRAMPSFSRIEVARPRVVQPLVEAEMVSGLKIKVFELTRETADLLVRLSGSGRVS